MSDSDYQFLAASADFDRREVQLVLEAERAKEVEARLAEEKKTARLKRFLLVAVGAGLVVSTGLGVGTFFQYRQAIGTEITALTGHSAAVLGVAIAAVILGTDTRKGPIASG